MGRRQIPSNYWAGLTSAALYCDVAAGGFLHLVTAAADDDDDGYDGD